MAWLGAGALDGREVVGGTEGGVAGATCTSSENKIADAYMS